jgi:DNA-binding XRE family transcriptional regulator
MNNELRVWRAKVRITQKELAKKVGCSRQTIVAIENGTLIPSNLLALRLARFF